MALKLCSRMSMSSTPDTPKTLQTMVLEHAQELRYLLQAKIRERVHVQFLTCLKWDHWDSHPGRRHPMAESY